MVRYSQGETTDDKNWSSGAIVIGWDQFRLLRELFALRLPIRLNSYFHHIDIQRIFYQSLFLLL